MIWLTVAATAARGEGLEHALVQLASIARFASDLDRRLAGDGFGSLARVHELHRRVLELLAAVSPDVGRARATVADLVASLHAMEDTLAALRRLKVELGHAQ